LLVEFPDDSALCWPVVAILVLLCWGSFLLVLIFFWAGEGGCLVVRFGVKEIKSWNLNLWFWRLHWEFNSDCPHMQQVRVMNHVGQKCCHPPLFLDTSVVECGI